MQNQDDKSLQLYKLRHSLAHVMAQAVTEIYPEVKLGRPADGTPAFTTILTWAKMTRAASHLYPRRFGAHRRPHAPDYRRAAPLLQRNQRRRSPRTV